MGRTANGGHRGQKDRKAKKAHGVKKAVKVIKETKVIKARKETKVRKGIKETKVRKETKARKARKETKEKGALGAALVDSFYRHPRLFSPFPTMACWRNCWTGRKKWCLPSVTWKLLLLPLWQQLTTKRKK
jgi:hypothetical protein